MTCALVCAAPAQAAELDLETLDGPTADEMMEDGKLTSVQLTRAYIARIAALNKRGPGLNAVSRSSTRTRSRTRRCSTRSARDGNVRGPAHGLPILLKDLIDVKGMYTSAGNYSLRNSFPPIDSGIAKKLRARGVVILGKLGLSEYANTSATSRRASATSPARSSTASTPTRTRAAPRRAPAPAGAAALSMLTIGTETSGSIISPSQRAGLVGLRPTVGLVPGYGIAPISASQDTAGPMERTVANAAMTLQSIAGPDPTTPTTTRPSGARASTTGHHPAGPGDGPELHVGARPELRARQAHRLQRHARPRSTQAKAALEAAGAIMVERPTIDRRHRARAAVRLRGQARHRRATTSDLGPDAPIKSLAEEEIADNQANAHEALKFGNSTHASALGDRHQPGSRGRDRLPHDLLMRQGGSAHRRSTT